jgi:hypothetical protein
VLGAKVICFTRHKIYVILILIAGLESINNGRDEEGWLEGIMLLLSGLSGYVKER